jgi:hypothetical protein
MGYKGKSAAAAAAAIAVVYGAYFWWARNAATTADVLAHMIGAIVAVAVIATVLEIVVAVIDRRAASSGSRTDERDRLIATRGARNGYYVLLSMIWVAPLLALSGAPSTLTANAILGMIVLAEMVHFGSRVVYDARGA